MYFLKGMTLIFLILFFFEVKIYWLTYLLTYISSKLCEFILFTPEHFLHPLISGSNRVNIGHSHSVFFDIIWIWPWLLVDHLTARSTINVYQKGHRTRIFTIFLKLFASFLGICNVKVDESGWNGRKWMKWMNKDESGLKWLKVEKNCEQKWMKVD